MTTKEMGIEFDIDDDGYEGALVDCSACQKQVWARVEWVQGASWGTNKLMCPEDHEIVRFNRNDEVI